MVTIKDIILTGNNRRDIRNNLINIFLEENAGTGKGEFSSNYIYNVETLKNGKRVQLRRPTFLNKGMDFTIHLENTEFRNKGSFRDKPKHEEIINDLLLKKQENIFEYEKVRTIINQIFICKNVSQEEYEDIFFTSGIEIEGILKVIKWLFIEQDITYWNYSGRYMLYHSLKEYDLV